MEVYYESVVLVPDWIRGYWVLDGKNFVQAVIRKFQALEK
jgi:hypothetical protein